MGLFLIAQSERRRTIFLSARGYRLDCNCTFGSNLNVFVLVESWFYKHFDAFCEVKMVARWPRDFPFFFGSVVFVRTGESSRRLVF